MGISIVKYIKIIYNEIINMVYPRRCPVCDEILSQQGFMCCKECLNKLMLVTEPICKKCGKIVEDDTIEYCFDCSHKKRYFIEGRGVYVYDKLMKASIGRFKYNGKKEYGDFYADEVVKYLGTYIKNNDIELIIPVPIHRDKLIKRGYNQADVIARLVGRKLNIPVLSNGLIRRKNTVPQKELNNIQRYKNLSNAFRLNLSDNNSKLIDKVNNILIVDDIYTTGATVNACAEVLKKYKNYNVYFITVTIGQGK